MSVPRGFKAKADRIAVGVRLQVGLEPEAPIDLPILATHLNLTLVPVTDFDDALPLHISQLVKTDIQAFSALLLPVGNGKGIILYNDRHSQARLNSSIAHEISHALLMHPPTLLFDHTGCRTFDKNIEDEANCLAGYILIPNKAAWNIVKSGMAPLAACERYGVSHDMLEFRLNASGARIRHRRLQKILIAK